MVFILIIQKLKKKTFSNMFKCWTLCGLFVRLCCSGLYFFLSPGITVAVEAPIRSVRFLFLLSCYVCWLAYDILCVARRHVLYCCPRFLPRPLIDIKMQEWSLGVTGMHFLHLPSLLLINISMWTTFIYGFQNVCGFSPLPSLRCSD